MVYDDQPNKRLVSLIGDGCRAWEDGKSYDANPNPPDTLSHLAWNTGWHRAAERATKLFIEGDTNG
uniref:Uncharacterized protein n=1 Tax=viral metagenome TaxID=1070528 RepID=A0A6M3IQN0_9ZZZZ